MGSLRTWIDWGVLAACMAAALLVVFSGIQAVQSLAWTRESPGHAAAAVAGGIFALAAVKCGFLVGAGVCKARRDRRLGARRA